MDGEREMMFGYRGVWVPHTQDYTWEANKGIDVPNDMSWRRRIKGAAGKSRVKWESKGNRGSYVVPSQQEAGTGWYY